MKKCLIALGVAAGIFAGGIALAADNVTCYSTKKNGALKPVDLGELIGGCVIEKVSIRSGIIKVRCEDHEESFYFTTADLVCVNK